MVGVLANCTLNLTGSSSRRRSDCALTQVRFVTDQVVQPRMHLVYGRIMRSCTALLRSGQFLIIVGVTL
jgi:hypothetical protein